MALHDSFDELMNRLRRSDQDAATVVFLRFRDRLMLLARKKLDRRIQRRVDPEDVVLSVYRSFFTRHKDGRCEVSTWDELWSLLTVITARKCINRAEYHLAKRRTAAVEVDAGWGNDLTDGLEQIISREPTPLQAAILEETVEGLMRPLEVNDRAIIELLLQGYSTREIGERLGFAERTVGRMKTRIKRRLLRMQAEGT